MKKIKKIYEALQMELREHKTSFIVYFVLRILVIIVMISQLFKGHYENVFYCLLTLILLIIPSFLQVTFKIELPTTLEIIILLFIFSAEILGEVHDYYYLIPNWDIILHTLNGFLAAAVGFSLVNLLNESDRFQFTLSPLYLTIVAFCFSMTIGVIWEFFEFAMDYWFGLNMQKDVIINSINTIPTINGGYISINGINEVIVNGYTLPIKGYIDIGLIDTMEDLLVNFIGASAFSIFGYFYSKNPNKRAFVQRFIPTKKEKNKDYLKKVFRKKENQD